MSDHTNAEFASRVERSRERTAARQRERIAMRDELAKRLCDEVDAWSHESELTLVGFTTLLADRLMNEGWIKGGGE